MGYVPLLAALIGFASVTALHGETVGPAWWFARDRPCRSSPTLAEAQRSMAVFEGTVVDDWNQVVVDGWSVRLLRNYRVQVHRAWSRHSGREVHLVHGWSDGERYMSGSYRVFQRGRRYLITSASYDAPAHTFATSCFPGAAGDEIASLAARLGPPVVTYEHEPTPDVPLRLRVERDAVNALWFGSQLRDRILDVIGVGGL